MELEELRKLILAQASDIHETVEKFQADTLALLEEAKNNEILKAIKALDHRLGALELRIPIPAQVEE